MEITTTGVPPQVQQVKQRLGIIGNTPALIEAVQRALKVAPIDLSVLVTGESGSGKEFFPQIIHQNSARKHSKYIAVNCGAIPEGTIDSELFGHEKGSFTGAVSSRKGYFEEADGGTIFLDEVGELPLTTQARLLRVLETGEFMKVGSSTVQKTNIRIVAATNVDMARAVAEGRFREDLYYRLSTVQINVPPLRDRGSDILLLARKFAADFAEHYHMPQITLGDDARRLLLSYRWPGNVRQLKNVIEQASLFQAGQEVGADVLHSYLPPDVPHLSNGTSLQTMGLNSYEREREMLFGMIFRLQQELADLRATLEKGQPAPTITQALTTKMPSPLTHLDAAPFSKPDVTVSRGTSPAGTDIIDIDASEVKAPDTTPQTPVFSGRLEDTERESIRQSLQRNHGNRKLTARELSISERTLYRKIKEYNLD